MRDPKNDPTGARHDVADQLRDVATMVEHMYISEDEFFFEDKKYKKRVIDVLNDLNELAKDVSKRVHDLTRTI